MSEYASTEDLVESGHDVDDVELSGGRKVQVRSYTRYELVIAGQNTEDPALVERRILRYCLVQPAMTMAQVEAWQKSSKPNDIARVITRIRELSGMAEGAAKSDVDPVRD